jgi:plasmid stabilization system protein ParE
MRVLKRPQFLLDLAEELTWLREKAGADVAERWYQALRATIEDLKRHPHLGRERVVSGWRSHPKAFVLGASSDFPAG